MRGDFTVEELETLPVFDRGALLARLGGDELVGRFVTLFAESSSGYLSALREALNAGDAPQVRSNAHAIKGAAANISALRLHRLAAAMEQHGSAGELAGAAELFPRLEEGLSDFRKVSAPL